MLIPPPPVPANHPDHTAACQQALEPAVQALIATAVAARWGELKVAEAIMTIAEHHVLSSIENELVRAKLLQIQESLGRGHR